jgi:hypothetical protein
MNRISSRAIAAAGALALAGGTVLAAALPASAATGPDNSSWALDANGFVTVPPVAEADSFGLHVAHVSHINNLSLLTTTGAAIDTAFSAGASSTVALVNVRGPGTVLSLTARVARSSCADAAPPTISERSAAPADLGDATGSTTIVGGLVGFGGFGAPLPVNPKVNQVIDVPGVGTVTLNDQDNSDGHLTVIAMSIQTRLGEVINVGTSVCDDTAVGGGT